MQWRPEAERWRKACDKVTSELHQLRDTMDTVRAFLRQKGLMEELMEFTLAARIGEAPARELLEKCREERRVNAAHGQPDRNGL